jgi:hypothetical protein
MSKESPRNTRRHSPHAALPAVGLKVDSLKLLDAIKKKVVILQKSVRHTPAPKPANAFVAELCGNGCRIARRRNRAARECIHLRRPRLLLSPGRG